MSDLDRPVTESTFRDSPDDCSAEARLTRIRSIAVQLKSAREAESLAFEKWNEEKGCFDLWAWRMARLRPQMHSGEIEALDAENRKVSAFIASLKADLKQAKLVRRALTSQLEAACLE